MICCWDHGSYLFKQSACKLKKAFIKTIKRCIGKEMWLRWKNIFKVDYLIEEKINYIYKKKLFKGHWFQLPKHVFIKDNAWIKISIGGGFGIVESVFISRYTRGVPKQVLYVEIFAYKLLLCASFQKSNLLVVRPNIYAWIRASAA